jgi:hypothetical protein
MDFDNEYDNFIDESLEGWVINKCDKWRDHFESNYSEKFDEYYRLWRGIWASEDSMRQSERSRIITPALQQAVESSVAEVEEATFGRGKWFDVRDDYQDKDTTDIAFLRTQLEEDFKFTGTRKDIAECILNAAVFGTGIGEIVLDEVKQAKPATQPIMDGAMEAVGVNIEDRFVVKLRPVMPQNFLIDPIATNIDDALGVAIDEFVPIHQVEMAQEQGIYRDVDIAVAEVDTDLEPDQDITLYTDDKVRLTKYYGLVPRNLLEKALTEPSEDGEEVEVVSLTEDDERGSEGYVEAVVVIANGGTLLKVEENPYMMQDRPVVAFPWDVVPSRFWGRGVCEKGYNSQKALDTELRARIDALALTVHPMMAVDASRLPRGTKLEVRPGKTILTNGNPSEVLQPFRFGGVDQVTFAQGAQLERMVQQATGAVDSAGMQGVVNGEATAGGISMGLGAIIKRHKRTLINFQEAFLIPFVTKAAHRYMQFAPDLYPVQDFKFCASSSLGIIAREYEVTQLVQLLQTMGQDSPLYPMLVEAVIDNMNISNREELIATLKQAQQPNPEAQQAAQQQQQMQMAQLQAQVQALTAQASEFQSRAQKYQTEAALAEYEAQTDRIKALSNNLDEGIEDEREFQRRAKAAELILKEQALSKGDNANGRNTAAVQQSNGGDQRVLQQASPAPRRLRTNNSAGNSEAQTGPES